MLTKTTSLPPVVLSATDLGFAYPVFGARLTPWRRQSYKPAVQSVSLVLRAGETLGLVGESGCGKSTLVALLCGDRRPDAGRVVFGDTPLESLLSPNRRKLARRLQVIGQDPLGAFDPRQPLGSQLREALAVHGLGTDSDRKARVIRALSDVALPASVTEKYPHQLSGGQRQRVAIARALAIEPDVLLCDEPVSALDVSIQAQVLNLLLSLQRERGLALLFVSHDVRVVRHMAHRVAVMRAGRIVESGPADTVLTTPSDPYTAALVAAVPRGRRSVRTTVPRLAAAS